MNKDTFTWMAIAGVLLVLIFGVAVFTDGLDATAYDRGHAALQELDCARAIPEYDKVISAPRLIDLRSFAFLSRQEKHQCELFQQGLALETTAPGDAAANYFTIISTYPDSPLNEQATSRVRGLVNAYAAGSMASEAFCSSIGASSDGNMLLESASSVNHPRVIDACGRLYESRADWKAAVNTYTAFLKDHPSTNWSDGFRQALARALMNEVSARSPGQVPAPTYIGGGVTSGKIVVNFFNDSPEPVRVVMIGPSTVIYELEACRGCPTYSAPGPATCPKQSRPMSFEMPEGNYTVVTESGTGDAITAAQGSWSLGSGQYESCITKMK